MKNLDIADRLNETASLLELQGANPFRVRAYHTASKSIADSTESIVSLAGDDPAKLLAIPGIGKDIAQKIVELIENGSFALLDELREEFPSGVLQIMHLPGLGPKKAITLHRELQVNSLDELKLAAEQGRVSALKGFSKKSEQSILDAIQNAIHTEKRYLISEALAAGELMRQGLLEHPAVIRAELAGSCRRRRETCGDLDLLITTSEPEEIMHNISGHPFVREVLLKGPTKQRVRLRNEIEMDIRVVAEESFGAAWQYFTGSQEHNVAIRKRAIAYGFSLNEYGLYRGEQLVAGANEEEIYAALELDWIPPELREDRGEIALAEAHKLPKLLTLEDIQADLHLHTTATDGTATIREMIEAARARGLKYMAITDHSKRVSIARGLDATRLRQHWDEIRKIREDYTDINVLTGIECDILEDGTMDLDDDVLAEAEWVIAVLHFGLKQPREQIMLRLLNAIRNPYVCAIGHPSGRLINTRAGAEIDYQVFLQAAADHGVMLEINSNPHRLDLSDRHAAAARDLGIPIVINTDAHSTSGYEDMFFGVDQARRAGLTVKDVANAWPFKTFQARLRTKRSSS